MPIYKPWLTVAAAVLAIIGTLSTNCNWLAAFYLALPCAWLIVSCFGLKPARSLLVLSLIPIATFAYASYRIGAPAPNDLSHYLNQYVVLTGRLIYKPEFSNSSRLVSNHEQNIGYTTIQVLTLIFPEQKTLSGKVRLLITNYQGNAAVNYEAGEIAEIRGRVTCIERKEEPWLSGLAAASRRNGIFCQIHAFGQSIKIVGQASPTDHFLNTIVDCIDRVRQHITNMHLRFLGTKAGSLLASMVLGDRAVSLDENLLNAFRKIGLSHIVAASGFNLTIVTMITYWTLRRLSLRKQHISFIVAGNVLLYAVLAGLSASIVRAAITCILVLIAHHFHRQLHNMATLSLVLIVNLIIDPSAIMDPGGQLSYAAVAGIILGAECIAKVMSCGSKNKYINIFTASLSIVLIAQTSVLPIQLYYFWQAGFLFLPANLLIDPLVAPITVVGFAASLAGILNLPFLSIGALFCHWLDMLAALPLQIIIFITEKLAAYNFSMINMGQPSIIAIIIYYLTLIICLISLAKERWRLLGIVLFICGLTTLFYRSELKQPVIVFLPNSILAINNQRQAICLGESDRKTNKVLAFYGASDIHFHELVNKNRGPNTFLLWTKSGKPLSLNITNDTTIAITTSHLPAPGRSNSNNETYIVYLHKQKTSPEQSNQTLYSSQHRFYCGQDQVLSLTTFRKELPELDLKICCPRNSLSFYYRAP